jgi:hypothetical protein
MQDMEQVSTKVSYVAVSAGLNKIFVAFFLINDDLKFVFGLICELICRTDLPMDDARSFTVSTCQCPGFPGTVDKPNCFACYEIRWLFPAI